jgi:uncharacterized membrane protein YdjX (TVP38/TMEM64 family)
MTDEGRRSLRRSVRIALLPLILGASVASYFLFEASGLLKYQNLAANHEWLLARVAENHVGIALGFVGAYALFVVLSLPGAAFRTMASGFLFGPALGTIYAVIGATLGATILFVIARASFKELFHNKEDGRLRKLADRFSRNALNYLLFLRLVPLFPFWIVNLAAAYVGMKIRIFAIATFIGIIPGTLVFSSMGSGLGDLLDQGEMPDAGIVFAPNIFLPLLGLAVLALAPIFIHHIRRDKTDPLDA